MTATLLPRFLADESGHPAYLARTAADDVTMRCYSPLLPDGSGWHWAGAADVTTGAVELTVGAVAELLMVSGISPDADEVDLIRAVDRALGYCRCDLRLVAAVASAYLAEHWECAAAYLDRCTLAAGRICGIEV